MNVTVILKGANGRYHYELSDFDFTGDMVRLIESFVAEQLKRNFKRLFLVRRILLIYLVGGVLWTLRVLIK